MSALLDNLPLKLVSLALALVLWFVIAGEKTSERGLSVPVELQNFPRNLELTGEAVNTVEVRIRASPSIIQALSPSEVSARIDLAGTGEGEKIVHLAPEDVRVPFGVRVVKITPSLLTLNFEPTTQRMIPVKPRLVGRPAPGYEVAEVLSEPSEIRIAGPRSRVERVDSAHTEPISVEGARAAATETVSIGLEDPVLRLAGPSRIRVIARIREVQERRTLQGLPVELRGGDGQARPAAVSVVIEGPVSLLARVEPATVRPYVQLAGAPDSGRAYPIAVELASGFSGASVVEVEPAEVVVRPLRPGRN